MASMAVNMPTSDVIPMATIQAVSTERSMFALTERRPSRTFSSKFMEFLID
jgi:hypothetical protein